MNKDLSRMTFCTGLLMFLFAVFLPMSVEAQSDSCSLSCALDCAAGPGKGACVTACLGGRCGNTGVITAAMASGDGNVTCEENGVCNQFCAGGPVLDPDCGLVCPGSFTTECNLIQVTGQTIEEFCAEVNALWDATAPNTVDQKFELRDTALNACTGETEFATFRRTITEVFNPNLGRNVSIGLLYIAWDSGTMVRCNRDFGDADFTSVAASSCNNGCGLWEEFQNGAVTAICDKLNMSGF